MGNSQHWDKTEAEECYKAGFEEGLKQSKSVNTLPNELIATAEANKRFKPVKHVEDWRMGAFDGWHECYYWIKDALKITTKQK